MRWKTELRQEETDHFGAFRVRPTVNLSANRAICYVQANRVVGNGGNIFWSNSVDPRNLSFRESPAPPGPMPPLSRQNLFSPRQSPGELSPSTNEREPCSGNAVPSCSVLAPSHPPGTPAAPVHVCPPPSRTALSPTTCAGALPVERGVGEDTFFLGGYVLVILLCETEKASPDGEEGVLR